ncbi:hypothetical protein NIES267_34450 [Calothrix parasitica NIES-267]|uniref:O-antigen polymerase n=1 Tax=Calothrix parasitica NIES-267 TaxID=1973488 RepID=A0A1Z4LS09_9CYAN|nr:hypothetical protein NIES267_34450 [Calothrix parasitica NIES-267]
MNKNLFLIHKNIISTLLCAFLFKFFLDLSYYFIIVNNFNIFIISSEISILKLLESYILLLVSTFFIAKYSIEIISPSRITIILYYIFIIIPMLSVYGFKSDIAKTSYMYMTIISFLSLTIFVQSISKIKLKKLSKNFLKIALFCSCLITLYVYGFLISSGGLGRINFNLYNVYLVREELKSYSAPFINYLIPWQAYIINISFFVFSLYKRIYLLIFISILGQILIFGMTNFKSFLFAPVLVLVLLWIGSEKKILMYFMMLSSIGLILTYTVYLITSDVIIPSIFIRRLFFLPANLHFYYYDFFSKNPHVFLSNSLLSSIFDYPYDIKVPELISYTYLNSYSNANAGYLADAYAHFGFAGMIIFSFILAVVLKILDSIGIFLPVNIPSAIITIPSMSLVNSALFTTMLTHGFILALITIWVLSSQINQTVYNNSLSSKI